VKCKIKEAEISLIKKEWDKMAKKNNELKLIILKMMHQINAFESQENNRYKSFYVYLFFNKILFNLYFFYSKIFLIFN
jgi:hypothetical protein